MPSTDDNASMALFCDFENVALGVRDAKYDKFDIKRVLERLLLKGSIVVKKAYCDWDRYKAFKAPMHEASFELIEIPHVRQSGKNSADIRLVVDALDLCYTKSHVNTFVIISGDSDFSPLVSKLRENNKKVIGVGVKQSTSDLLIANCDEFIFYDDLVRESQRTAAKRQAADATPQPRRAPEEERRRKDDVERRRTQAIEIAVETFEALSSERGDTGKIWASVLKEAIKRRKPDFNENYFGFRAFGNLLEEAQARGLLKFGRDERSGAYVYRDPDEDGPVARTVAQPAIVDRETGVENTAESGEARRARGRLPNGRRAGRSNRREQTAEAVALLDQVLGQDGAQDGDEAQDGDTPVIPYAPAMQEASDATSAYPEASDEAPRSSQRPARTGASRGTRGAGRRAQIDTGAVALDSRIEESTAHAGTTAQPETVSTASEQQGVPTADTTPSAGRTRRGRQRTAAAAMDETTTPRTHDGAEAVTERDNGPYEAADSPHPDTAPVRRSRTRTSRSTAKRADAPVSESASAPRAADGDSTSRPADGAVATPGEAGAAEPARAKSARKTPARPRRPRKTEPAAGD